MEPELFGVEQNGGVVKTGHFERAHGGTLFIDEVSDMPRETQAKILRVLTEQSFQRVGGNQSVKVDVRVVSATSKNLGEEMAMGRFREDLYHRLNVVPLTMPSLADRREDIPALVDYFFETLADTYGRPRRPIDQEVYAAFQAYDWPGNVRQLKNVVERILIMAAEKTNAAIGLNDLPGEITGGGNAMVRPMASDIVMTVPLREAREAFEREYLRLQINRFSGNISRTASFIGMERSALHRKLKTLGIGNGHRENGSETPAT